MVLGRLWCLCTDAGLVLFLLGCGSRLLPAGHNANRLSALQGEMPTDAFNADEQKKFNELIDQMLRLIANASDPKKLSDQSKKQLEELSQKLGGLSQKLWAGP